MSVATLALLTRAVTSADMPAIEALNARVFGPGRFVRTAYRVREGAPAASPFCRLVEIDGRLIASIRMTAVAIGARPGALLLGPLAVDLDFANRGYGRRLIAESLEAASNAGLRLVVLVGDVPYYGRLGFAPVPCGQITLPGPVNPSRLLARELQPGALVDYSGPIAADPSTLA